MSAALVATVAGLAALAAPAFAAAAAWRVHVAAAPAQGLTVLATLCAAGVLAASATGFGPTMAISLTAIAATALAIAVFDARRFLIPDGLVVVLAALTLSAPFAPPPVMQALGAAALGGLFLAVRLIYRSLRGRDGLGLGDVKLAAVIGLALGPERGLIAVAAAAFVAAAWLAWRQRGVSRSPASLEDQGPAVAPFGVPLALVLIAGVALELAPWLGSTA